MNKKLLFLLLITWFLFANNCSPKISKNLDNTVNQLTNYIEITKFIDSCANQNRNISKLIIGKSVQERNIYVVKIADNSNNAQPKVKILFMGQTHGNEPSGKEGLLLLIKYFTENKGSELLKNTELYIIPQLNPDGGQIHQRRNANNTDLNRNHVILSEPETSCLHTFFNTLLPEVTVDFHEYYPYDEKVTKYDFVKSTQLQFGTLTNINIDAEIRNISNNKILPYVINYVKANNFTSKEYTIGSLDIEMKLRNSTVDINDGRQSFGIQNTFSFIFEGLNGVNPAENIKKRAESQFYGALAIINYASDNKNEIQNTVKISRDKLKSSGKNDSVSIQMDHFNSNTTHKVHMHSKKLNKDSVFTIARFYTNIIPLFKVTPPKAYLVPLSDSLVLNLLLKHGLSYKKYNSAENDIINEYKIIKLQKDTLEESEFYNPTLENINKKQLTEPYAVFELNNIKHNFLILALEPKSMFSIINYKTFNYLVKNQAAYPILRLE